MSRVIYSCAHLLIDGLDASADLNSLTVNYGSESKDITTMGNDTRISKGGLKTGSIDAAGLLNLGSSLIDEVLWGKIGETDVVVAVFPVGINAGSTSLTGEAMGSVPNTLAIGGAVGEILPFSVTFGPSSDIVKAVVIEDFNSTAASTDGVTSASVNLVHCSTGEKLYAGWQVNGLTTSLGSSISAIIEAASSSGFGVGSTGQTLVTFGALSTKAGVVATPIAASAMSTDQPFLRAVITPSTGTSTCSNGTGYVWAGIQ